MEKNDTRTDSANLYLQHAPPEFLAYKIVSEMLQDLPQDQATAMLEAVVEKFKEPQVKSRLDDQCRSHLLEIFAQEELELLADFHASASKYGIWGKLEKYGNRLTPLLREILEEA
jgi:hypothetical protein